MPFHTAFLPSSLPLSLTRATQTLTPLLTPLTPSTSHSLHAQPLRHSTLTPFLPSPPALSTPSARILLWYHTDLRISDNPALLSASNPSNPTSTLIPVAAGAALHPRAKPLLQELAANLKALGSDLLAVAGNPHVELVKVCRKLKLDKVYYNRSVDKKNVETEKRVEAALKKAGIEVVAFWGNCLMDCENEVEDNEIPLFQTMMKKRSANKEVTKLCKVPDSLPAIVAEGVAQFERVGGVFGGGSLKANAILERMDKGKEGRLDETEDLIVRLKMFLDYGAVSAKMVANKCLEVCGALKGKTFYEVMWRDYVCVAAHRGVGVSSAKRVAVPV